MFLCYPPEREGCPSDRGGVIPGRLPLSEVETFSIELVTWFTVAPQIFIMEKPLCGKSNQVTDESIAIFSNYNNQSSEQFMQQCRDSLIIALRTSILSCIWCIQNFSSCGI